MTDPGSELARRATGPAFSDAVTFSVADPAAGVCGLARLGLTADGAGRRRIANLELWVGADDTSPRRATGEVVRGSTVDLGRLRLECAFMRWRIDGRSGVGRCEVARPA